jgi:hypothetical protein
MSSSLAPFNTTIIHNCRYLLLSLLSFNFFFINNISSSALSSLHCCCQVVLQNKHRLVSRNISWKCVVWVSTHFSCVVLTFAAELSCEDSKCFCLIRCIWQTCFMCCVDAAVSAFTEIEVQLSKRFWEEPLILHSHCFAHYTLCYNLTCLSLCDCWLCLAVLLSQM